MINNLHAVLCLNTDEDIEVSCQNTLEGAERGSLSLELNSTKKGLHASLMRRRRGSDIVAFFCWVEDHTRARSHVVNSVHLSPLILRCVFGKYFLLFHDYEIIRKSNNFCLASVRSAARYRVLIEIDSETSLEYSSNDYACQCCRKISTR